MHFAVAGCGVISRFHLDAIRSIEDAALCGVYDPVEASARAAAQAYGTRAYPDYDALLADPQVDAVCICTPSHLHAPLALQAVAAGKHVLIEKPVALTLEDCDAVAAAARAAGVQVGVVSQLRYGPAVARVKRALESGALGRIPRCDLYMKYFRPQSYYDSGTWRGTQAMDGGGALMNCRALHTVVLRADPNTSTCLQKLLGEHAGELDIRFDGNTPAHLLFPAYTEELEDLPPAHIFQRRIHGAGYGHRQCFDAGVLSFRQYDLALTGLLERHDFAVAARVAARRLAVPYALSDTARDAYLDCLRAHGGALLDVFGDAKRFREGVVEELLAFPALGGCVEIGAVTD